MTASRTTLLMLCVAFCAMSLEGAEMKLKEAYKGYFYTGASFGKALFKEEGQSTLGLIADQFNSITPGNELKWGPFNPKPDSYNQGPADSFVAFGQKNNMYVVGHVLFWHNQTPNWVFEDANGKQLNREALLKRMRERVRYVANRYKGRIHAWDVVNEAILDNGKLRDSKWTQIVGDDFVEQAFRIADAELPKDVELIYNDYSMTGEGKRDAVVKMVNEFKKKGIRIDGVGMQGHWSLNGPSVGEIELSIRAFSKAGVDVHITELDIDMLPRKKGMWGADVRLKLQGDPSMDPYRSGLPDEMQKKLAKRYEDLFRIFIKHSDKIKRVTFWGPTDRYSWLNNWPIVGRTSYPLLFDREGKPKPAYSAVIDLGNQQLKQGSPNG